MSDDQDFMFGGGGGYASFTNLGDYHGGYIVKEPVKSNQTDIKTGEVKRWPDGNPMLQLLVTLQTDERDPAKPDDTGIRTLYLKGSTKSESESLIASAVGAVKAAGGAKLEVGGWLGIQHHAVGVASGIGMSPPKKYRAQYRLPDAQGLAIAAQHAASAVPATDPQAFALQQGQIPAGQPAFQQPTLQPPPGAAVPMPGFVAPGAVGAPLGLPQVAAPMPGMAAPGFPPAAPQTDPWAQQQPVQGAPAGWPAVPGAAPQQPAVGFDQVQAAAAAMGAPQGQYQAPAAVSPVEQVRAMLTAGQDVASTAAALGLQAADMAQCLLLIGYDVPTVSAQTGLPSTTVQLLQNTLR